MTSLLRMAKDSVVSRHLTFEVNGGLGEVPADVATPLAVVLAELVQNAIEHAFLDFAAEEDGDGDRTADQRPDGDHPGGPVAEDGLLRVEVLDDGSGLPDGLRHRRHPEPRAVDRPRPRPQSARRHHHDAGPERARPGERGTLVVIELPAREPQPIGQ